MFFIKSFSRSLEEKVIDLEDKIVSRANTDDLTTKQIKKEGGTPSDN